MERNDSKESREQKKAVAMTVDLTCSLRRHDAGTDEEQPWSCLPKCDQTSESQNRKPTCKSFRVDEHKQQRQKNSQLIT